MRTPYLNVGRWIAELLLVFVGVEGTEIEFVSLFHPRYGKQLRDLKFADLMVIAWRGAVEKIVAFCCAG